MHVCFQGTCVLAALGHVHHHWDGFGTGLGNSTLPTVQANAVVGTRT
jgi:hypothetical protein